MTAVHEEDSGALLSSSSLSLSPSRSSPLPSASVVSPISSPLRCPTSVDEETDEDIDDDVEATEKRNNEHENVGDGSYTGDVGGEDDGDLIHPREEQLEDEQKAVPNEEENEENIAESKSVLGFSHNLLRKIEDSRTLFDTYLKQQRDAIDDVIRRQKEAREREGEEIDEKVNELKQIKVQLGLLADDSNESAESDSKVDLSRERQDGGVMGLDEQDAILKQKLEQMEKEMAECKLQRELAERNVKVVKEIEEREFTKAEDLRKQKERVAASKRFTVDDLTLAVLKYESLGLKFFKHGADIRCEFTRIDPRDLDRVFSFILNVNDMYDMYEVEDCQPKLSAAVVLSLVRELNENDAISTFIVGMRKAFRDSISP